MNPLIIIAGVFIFVSGILLGRQSQSPNAKIFSLTETSQNPTHTPTPESSQSPTTTQIPEESTPKPTSSPTHTPRPTSIPVSSSTNLSDFKYPKSSITSENGTKIVLTSTDSPQTITSWYENRMKELGYSSRASAKTNTNGNVTNKLGGGKDNNSIAVEIIKKANEGATTVTVTAGTDSSSDVHIKIENNEPYL